MSASAAAEEDHKQARGAATKAAAAAVEAGAADPTAAIDDEPQAKRPRGHAHGGAGVAAAAAAAAASAHAAAVGNAAPPHDRRQGHVSAVLPHHRTALAQLHSATMQSRRGQVTHSDALLAAQMQRDAEAEAEMEGTVMDFDDEADESHMGPQQADAHGQNGSAAAAAKAAARPAAAAAAADAVDAALPAAAAASSSRGSSAAHLLADLPLSPSASLPDPAHPFVTRLSLGAPLDPSQSSVLQRWASMNAAAMEAEARRAIEQPGAYLVVGIVDVIHELAAESAAEAAAGGASAAQVAGICTLNELAASGPIFVLAEKSKSGDGRSASGFELFTLPPAIRSEAPALSASLARNKAPVRRLNLVLDRAQSARGQQSQRSTSTIYNGLAAWERSGSQVYGAVYVPPGGPPGRFIIRWYVTLLSSRLVDASGRAAAMGTRRSGGGGGGGGAGVLGAPLRMPIPAAHRLTEDNIQEQLFVLFHMHLNTAPPQWTKEKLEAPGIEPCRVTHCPKQLCRNMQNPEARSLRSLLQRAEYQLVDSELRPEYGITRENLHKPLPPPADPLDLAAMEDVQSAMARGASSATLRFLPHVRAEPHQLMEVRFLLDRFDAQDKKLECVTANYFPWPNQQCWVDVCTGLSTSHPTRGKVPGSLLSSSTGIGKTLACLLYMGVLAARWRRLPLSQRGPRPIFVLICHSLALCTQWLHFLKKHPGLEGRQLSWDSRTLTSLVDLHDDAVLVLVAEQASFRHDLPFLSCDRATAIKQEGARDSGTGAGDAAAIATADRSPAQSVARAGRSSRLVERETTEKVSLLNIPLLDVLLDECQFLSGDVSMENINKLQSTSRLVISGTVFEGEDVDSTTDSRRFSACDISQFADVSTFLRMNHVVFHPSLPSWWKAASFLGLDRMYRVLSEFAIRTRKENLDPALFPKERMRIKCVSLSQEHARTYNCFVAVILRNAFFSHWSFDVPSPARFNPNSRDHMSRLHHNYERALANRSLRLIESNPAGVPRTVAKIKRDLAHGLSRIADGRTIEQLEALVLPEGWATGQLAEEQKDGSMQDDAAHKQLQGLGLDSAHAPAASAAAGASAVAAVGPPLTCDLCRGDFPLPIILPCGHVICVLCCRWNDRAALLFPLVPSASAEDRVVFESWCSRTRVRCPVSSCTLPPFPLVSLHEMSVMWSFRSVGKSKGRKRKAGAVMDELSPQQQEAEDDNAMPTEAAITNTIQAIARMATDKLSDTHKPNANVMLLCLNPASGLPMAESLDQMHPAPLYAWCGPQTYSSGRDLMRRSGLDRTDMVASDNLRFDLAKQVKRRPGCDRDEIIRSFKDPGSNVQNSQQEGGDSGLGEEDCQAAAAAASNVPALVPTPSLIANSNALLALGAGQYDVMSVVTADASSLQSAPLPGVTLRLPLHADMLENDSLRLFAPGTFQCDPSKIFAVSIFVSTKPKFGHFWQHSSNPQTDPVAVDNSCYWEHHESERAFHLRSLSDTLDINDPSKAVLTQDISAAVLSHLVFRAAPVQLRQPVSPASASEYNRDDQLYPGCEQSQVEISVRVTTYATAAAWARRHVKSECAGLIRSAVWPIRVRVQQRLPVIRRLMVVASVDDIVGVDAPHVSNLLEHGFTIKRAMRMQIRARPSRLFSSNPEVWIHTVVGAGTMDMMSAIRFNEKPYERDACDEVHHTRIKEHMQRVRDSLTRDEWRSADKAVGSSQARVECAHDIFLLDFITMLTPDEISTTTLADNQPLITHSMEDEPQAAQTNAASSHATTSAMTQPAQVGSGAAAPAAASIAPALSLGLPVEGDKAASRASLSQPHDSSVSAAAPLPSSDGPQPMELVTPTSSLAGAAPTGGLQPPMQPVKPHQSMAPAQVNATNTRPSVNGAGAAAPASVVAANTGPASASSAPFAGGSMPVSVAECICGFPSAVWCRQCETPLCHDCSAVAHAEPGNSHHDLLPMQSCSRKCGKLADRRCRQCPSTMQWVCEPCFAKFHVRGNLLQHACERLFADTAVTPSSSMLHNGAALAKSQLQSPGAGAAAGAPGFPPALLHLALTSPLPSDLYYPSQWAEMRVQLRDALGHPVPPQFGLVELCVRVVGEGGAGALDVILGKAGAEDSDSLVLIRHGAHGATSVASGARTITAAAAASAGLPALQLSPTGEAKLYLCATHALAVTLEMRAMHAARFVVEAHYTDPQASAQHRIASATSAAVKIRHKKR